MKRLFSFVLVLAMLVTMSISVFADEVYTASNRLTEIQSDSDKSGTIRITNATAEQTYTVYKLFSAAIAADKDSEDESGVYYTLDPTTDAFKRIFGTLENPTNQYFNFNISDNRVSLKDTATDSVALVKYFQKLIQDYPNDFPYVAKQAQPVTDSEGNVIEKEVTLEFAELQYGYYLIDSTLGGVATLDSNAPTMTVVDKNQAPGNVDKWVKKEGQEYNTTSNNVGIGDVVTYKIEFTATNYAGQEKIRYYEVFDKKGTGIWAEFNSFRVQINGEDLPGYYLKHGGNNTNNWSHLDSWGDNTDNANIQDAAWYLVHTGYDTYSILIPWINEYTVVDDPTNENMQNVDVAQDGTFKYDSPVNVTITYNAAIEPNANIGGGNGTNGNLFNEAHLEWHTKFTQGSTQKDIVYSETYGLSIQKEDFNTKANLAGATFRVYKDYVEDQEGNKELRNPVYVIPTGIAGVYMVDSKGTASQTVTGTYMDDAREYFAGLRDPNGNKIMVQGDVWVENTALTALGEGQTNEVVTAENGRLVILGLDLGDYFFDEVKAPDGYNKLTQPFSITITKDSNTSISIYADADGSVVTESKDADYTYTYMLTNQPVQNSKGAELPSTGGEGRMMLITVGSIIAMCFAVLLITQKKMSVYRD